MEKNFDFSEVPGDNKFKFAVTRLNKHALLWWDGVHVERRRLHKKPIKSWSRMIAKLKEKFLPRDYQLALYRHAELEIRTAYCHGVCKGVLQGKY